MYVVSDIFTTMLERSRWERELLRQRRQHARTFTCMFNHTHTIGVLLLLIHPDTHRATFFLKSFSHETSRPNNPAGTQTSATSFSRNKPILTIINSVPNLEILY